MTSLYSIASDQEQGAALAEDIISALQVFGLEWMVLGDYNVTTSETGWHHGWHRGCHGPLTRPSPAEQPLPGTAGGGRRIDFGLGSVRLCPQQSHAEGLANHVAVRYHFELAVAEGRLGPSRAAFVYWAEAVSSSLWGLLWQEVEFQRLLLEKDLDGAWQLLSDTAEGALGRAGRDGIARSQPWQPRREVERSKGGQVL